MDAAAPTLPHFREIVVVLTAFGLVVPALKWLRINPVLGYLLVGAAIGPFGLALFSAQVPFLGWVVVQDTATVHMLAELGIIFLLFVLGLELSLDRALRMRGLVFGLGGAQVLLTTIVIGAAALAFGNALPAAIVLGACFALSSTAIVAGILSAERRLGEPVGRVALAVLIFQDLAVVPILVLVGLFGGDGQQSLPVALGLALLKAAAAIIIIFVLGRTALRPVFRFVSAQRSPELFIGLTLLVITVTAAATEAAGLSMALGAFLAGLLLSETEFRHQIEADVAPFKGLLVALFFVTIGMGIDVRVFADAPLAVALSVAGLFTLKAFILFGLARSFGLARPVAFEVAVLLGGAGEFAFIVIGLSLTLGVIDQAVGQFMLLVTGLSMVLTPLTAGYARRMAARLQKREVGEMPSIAGADLVGHVLIAGYGRVGQLLSSALAAEGVPYVALDAHPQPVAAGRARGEPVFLGDAARGDLLERAGAAQASALVVTMDDPAATERVIAEARRRWPDLAVHARARDVAHMRALEAAGATQVVPENLEATLQLVVHTFVGLGMPREAATRIIDQMRRDTLGIAPSPE